MVKHSFLEIFLGAVVLASAVFFLSIALGELGSSNGEGYELEARFETVAGLAPGADVRIGGIKVGRVSARTIDKKYFDAVVTLVIDNDLSLPEDSIATIQADGLLGGRYVQLIPGKEQTKLSPGDEFNETINPKAIEDLLSRAIFLLSEDS